LWQGGRGGSTNGSFVLFADCSGGYGCFVKQEGSATFRQCLFVGNLVGAIAHSSWGATSQTRMEWCWFVNPNLKGDVFEEGSVLLDGCLFAGEVQLTANVTLTGV
jgi:hypothetical protein